MIDVTCAVIRNEEDEVLIVQRGEATDHPFKWEFPGGKLNSEETEDECIIREIKEELSIDIIIFGRLPAVEYDYGHKKIKLIPFICDTLDDIPFLSEHIAYKWVNTCDLRYVDFSEADVFVANSYREATGAEEKKSGRAEENPYMSDDKELQGMINRMAGMKEAEWVAVSAIENPAIFLRLIEYSYSSDKKLAFHASWILTKVCDKYPEIIHPHLTRVVERIGKLDNESALRSFLRILSLTDLTRLDKKHHGILVHECFGQLNSGFSAIAIKAYAMEILYRLSVIYPELKNELAISIRKIMDLKSAGIVSRGRAILKRISQSPVDENG